MATRTFAPLLLAATLALAAPGPARADYTLSRTAVSAAGTSGALAPPYRLAATLAQPAAGQMAGGVYGLWTGFLWPRPTPTTGVDPGAPRVTRVAWLPARPNPASSRTTLAFELPEPLDVRVDVFSVDGRRVASPFAGHRDAGRHTLEWACTDAAGRHLAPGVYLAVLSAGSIHRSQRLVVLGH